MRPQTKGYVMFGEPWAIKPLYLYGFGELCLQKPFVYMAFAKPCALKPLYL